MSTTTSPRYGKHEGQPRDEWSMAHDATVFAMQREWCARKNDGAHRKVKGTSTCVDCGTDLDL